MTNIAYTVGGHLATLYNRTTAVGTTEHTDYNGMFRLYKHSNVTDNTVNTALYLDTMTVRTGTMPYTTGWTTTSFDYTNSVIQSNTNKAVGSFKPYTALQEEEHKGVVSVTLPETETYLYTWLPNTALNNTSSAFSARMQYSVSGNSEYALDVLSFTAPTHWSDTLYAYNKPKLNLSYTNIGKLQNIYMPSNAVLCIGGTNLGFTEENTAYYYNSDYQDISADNVTANIIQYAIGSGATKYVPKYPTYHHINNSTISFTCNDAPTIWGTWGDFTRISSFNNSNITASAFTANNAYDSNFVIVTGDPNETQSHLVFENGVIDNCTFDCADAHTYVVYFNNCTVTNVTALSDNVVFRYQ